MLNKRGHIGTALMVLGALVLVIATLYSFAIFSDKTGGEKERLNSFISEFSFEEKYVSAVLMDMVEEAIDEAKTKANFEEEFEKSLIEIAKRRRDEERKNNLFARLILEPPNFYESNGAYFLKVEDVFVKFDEDKNSIERKFHFEIEFDKDRIISQSL